jgi:Mg-chelatase subunit ChlD
LNLFKLKPDIDKLLDNLFTGGVTKFLYGNKPILYGTVGNDFLSADELPPRSIGDGGYISFYPTLELYRDNGVVLIGGQGADNLTGASKDDVFIGGKGDDEIDGRDGSSFLFGLFSRKDKDESRYQGARSDYDIEFLSDKSVKITDKVSDRDGSDTLTNIETAIFSDKSVDLRPGQDIAFVIDTTGSMFDDIDAVKASAGDIINSIFDSFLNSRIAVVGYNDPTTNTFLSFTDQPKIEDRKTAALQAINSISVGGGGDFPEVVNAGLIRALSGGAGEWRKEANARRIILFGDAPAKDTDLFDQVVQLAANLDVSVSARSLLASDVQTTNPTDGLAVTSFSVLSADAAGAPIVVPVEIFSVLIGNDPSAAADFTKLANATGGKNFQAADASQVVSVLIDALKQSAQAPIAIADTTSTTSSTSVEINVLSNDSDPNDDSLTITKINNSDISLGDKVTLSSGAIVSLNDAGILVYDPNGKFDLLAPEATASDSFEYTVGDGNGNFDTATVTVDITGSLQRTLSLGKIADDIFTISGNTPKLQVNLAGRNSNLVNELGVFTVDDAQGKINGIAPGETGYTQAALNKSKVIFSTIANVPNGFDINNLTSLIEFESGNNLRFLLVKNGTIDSVQNGITPTSDILFSDLSRQKITDLGTDGFSLAWKDGSNNNTDFKDLVVNIKSTDDSLPLGTNLQGKQQGEVLDLRGITNSVKADFTVNREAAFNNFVGFYKVADENGGIDVDGNGTVDFRPGDSGYAQAAMKNRVTGIDLGVDNQGTGTFTDKTLTGGSIFAPFILTDGRTVDQVLNGQVDQTYFAYLGANSDKVDHIRLLGNNVFGFEDLAGGGDKDYNDIIVKVNLSVV